jgi:hypothetical protein
MYWNVERQAVTHPKYPDHVIRGAAGETIFLSTPNNRFVLDELEAIVQALNGMEKYRT